MVKIELIWAGMENSCYCLGLGARKEDGQARTWTGNLGLGPSEHTAHLPDSREQSQEGREEYGTLERSNSSRAQGVCVCVAFRLLEIALVKASLEKLRVRGRVFPGFAQGLNDIVRARTQAWITTPSPELWPLTPYLRGCPNRPDLLGMWCRDLLRLI